MRIKIFEDIKMKRSYTIVYPVMNAASLDPYLENENNERASITMNELYHLLDKLFKDNHAINQGRTAWHQELR